MERRFPRDISALCEIFSFTSGIVASHGLDASSGFWVDFVVEELFTNMVKYNRDGTGEIAIRITVEARRIVITVTDFDAPFFDVTDVPQVDVTRPISERQPGGLGLHLVRQMADEVTYAHENRSSTVTVTKTLET